MNMDTLKGALRSKTIIVNGAALALFGVLPPLLQDTAVMQGIVAILPGPWQAVALAVMPLVNFWLRTKTTQSLEAKGEQATAPANQPTRSDW